MHEKVLSSNRNDSIMTAKAINPTIYTKKHRSSKPRVVGSNPTSRATSDLI